MGRIYNFYTLSVSTDSENVRYVGVTTRKVSERFYGHKYCAMHEDKRGLPVHKWMWTHYLNGDDIKVTQIDSCDEALWEEREKYWISYYKDNGYQLLNISKGGNGVVTKEMREYSSIERSIKGHEKAIVALNKDGSFYKEYSSIKQATEELGLKSLSAISNVLKGRSKSSKGFMWVYKENYDPTIDYEYNINTYRIKVYEFDINGILINEYPSKSYFENLEGWSINGISAAIKDKKLYHGSYWSTQNYINIDEYEPYFKYQEIDEEGQVIELYHDQYEIGIKYNISSSHVCLKIKEGSKFSSGNKIIKL